MRGRTPLLVLLCTAQFVDVLDVNAVLVALPSIGRDLHLDPGALQWVVTAYVLVFAGVLLVAGRLADALGRRGVFAAGVALFTAASAACGAAPSAPALGLARAAQGLGAALCAPAALAMIVDAFPPGRPRERAVAAWTGVAAVGGATGILLGGVITSALGWRWIFFVNVPVGLATLALTPRLLRGVEVGRVDRATAGGDRAGAGDDRATVGHERAAASPDRTASGADFARSVAPARLEWRRSLRGLDLPGAAGVTGGLGLLVLALAQAEQAGAFGAVPLAALGGALALLVAFALRERSAARPLVPPSLLRMRAVVAALAAAAVLTATTSGGAVLATLHLQDVLGMDPAAAGLMLLPLSVAVVAGSVAAARVRTPAPAVIAGGIGLVAAGSAAATATLSATAGAAGVVAWGVLGGLGLGGASVAATTLGASAVPEPDRGTVAGLLNTAAQVGTAVGVAVLVLVAGTADAATGHRIGFAAAAAAAAIGALLQLRLARPLRRRR